MAKSSDILIVGGGIWGLSTAYHLAAAGVGSVRVLERGADVAAETTPRAAGLIGQIRTTPVMFGAIRYALDLLDQFIDKSGQDAGLRRPGSLMVALTRKRMEAYHDLLALAKANGVKSNIVDADEMMRMCPEMNSSTVEGGLFVEGDGYVDAKQCALAYAAAARERGATIETAIEVTGIEISDGAVRGVNTANGAYAADRVVVTCGPWTAQVTRLAGFELPIQTIRHQRARTALVEGIPYDHPVVRVTDVSCYLRPDQGGYLFGFFEPDPYLIDLDKLGNNFRTEDIAEPHDTIAEAVRRLAPVFPALPRLEIAEYRQGVTSFAPDGKYLIGPVPGVEGLFAASGCAAVGIAGSAAIGYWLTQWVTDSDPGDDLEGFGLQRFSAYTQDRSWVRDESRNFYANYYSIESMGGRTAK